MSRIARGPPFPNPLSLENAEGTEGSNPSSSSGESGELRNLARAAAVSRPYYRSGRLIGQTEEAPAEPRL